MDYMIFAETEQNVCAVANPPPHKNKKEKKEAKTLSEPEMFSRVLVLVT